MRRILGMTAAAVVAGSCVWASGQAVQTGARPAGAADQQAKGAVDDRLFAAAAAESGLAEVASSQLAVARASSPELKKFAQQMIDDHTKANRELMALASRKQLALPTAPGVTHQAEANCLAGLRGEEFDRAYAKQQFAAHICAVGLFKAESERGRDADLKALAAKTLPALKEHLRMIHGMASLKEDVSGDSASNGAHDETKSTSGASRTK